MTRNDQDERYDLLDRDYNTYPLVRDNPLNRETAFGIHHHTDWADTKSHVVTGLADIRDAYDDHVLAVGGDKGGRGGLTKHYVIKFDDEGEYGEYVLQQAGVRDSRERFSEAGKMLERLDELWPEGSFTYAALVHESQSEFMYKERDDEQQTDRQGRPIAIAA